MDPDNTPTGFEIQDDNGIWQPMTGSNQISPWLWQCIWAGVYDSEGPWNYRIDATTTGIYSTAPITMPQSGVTS
jgi:hypothetical protein